MPDDEQGQRPAAAPPAERKAPAKAPAKKAPARKAAAAKAPAKKATAKKAPEKRAPAKKATARKAPAKKATARKAPAKKAPAKRASARTTSAPRSRILDRISELEERFTAEARAGSALPSTTTAALPTPPPVAVAVVPEVEPPVASPLRKPRPVPVVAEPEPAPRTLRSDGLARTMLIAIMLLLAAAAAMAAAAFVKDRPGSWRAESVVAITAPGGGHAEDVDAARRRFQAQVNGNAFTAQAAALAGVRSKEVRSLITSKLGKPGELELVARAGSADAASRLAEGASRQLVLTVLTDQRTVSDPAKRLGAKVVVPTSLAERQGPRDRSVWLAAALGALDVLLVCLMLGVFGARSRRRRLAA